MSVEEKEEQLPDDSTGTLLSLVIVCYLVTILS